MTSLLSRRLYFCVPESGESFVGKGPKYKPYFAQEMAEEYAVNIEPYQFEPMSSKSDGESSDDSSDNTYDVNEERIGKVDW